MSGDQQQKLELADRMHTLWKGSGVTQEHIADAIGLKHRSYQKALQTGGISYGKLRKLADFHNVDFNWLMKGETGPTPDLLGGDVQKQLAALSAWMQALTEAVVPLLEREEAERLSRLAGNAQPPGEAPPESQSPPGDQPRGG